MISIKTGRVVLEAKAMPRALQIRLQGAASMLLGFPSRVAVGHRPGDLGHGHLEENLPADLGLRELTLNHPQQVVTEQAGALVGR